MTVECLGVLLQCGGRTALAVAASHRCLKQWALLQADGKQELAPGCSCREHCVDVSSAVLGVGRALFMQWAHVKAVLLGGT